MRTLVLAIGVFALGALLGAQQKNPPSLGAVAKAAQEEKAKAKPATADQKSGDQKTETAAGKKYSNENLDGRSRPSSAKPSPKLISGSEDIGNSSKDQAYWRARADEVRQRVQYSKDKLNAAKAELERSRTSGPLYIKPADRGTSPVEAERQRLSAKVSELEAEARREEQAMTQLEEEARRAGVPPGWLR